MKVSWLFLQIAHSIPFYSLITRSFHVQQIQWQKLFFSKRARTCHLFWKRPGCYHSISMTHVRERILKLSPMHASVIYRIHWIRSNHWIVLLHLGKTPLLQYMWEWVITSKSNRYTMDLRNAGAVRKELTVMLQWYRNLQLHYSHFRKENFPYEVIFSCPFSSFLSKNRTQFPHL